MESCASGIGLADASRVRAVIAVPCKSLRPARRFRAWRGFALACLSLAVSPASDARVQLTDTTTAGIRTVTEFDAEPFGYRVNWIDWDSNFRASDLRIGDRIVGVEGEPYSRRDHRHHHAIGDYRESAYWAGRGATDGHPVTLSVVRNGAELDVKGTLRTERMYFGADDRRTLGEGGPPRHLVEKDENGRRLFDSSWAAWYERKTDGKPDSFAYYLDGGWERSGFNNVKALAKHENDRARVEFALEHYPGRFSDTLHADYERVRDYLQGRVVDLPDDALDFRERAKEWQREVAAHGKAAIEAFDASLGDRLDTAPGVSKGGIAALAKAYVGKVVYFDGLGPRDIINDLGQAFLVAGSARSGYFFVQAESPVMARVFDALVRYRSLVNPGLAERYSAWIDVKDEPMMLNYKGSTVTGLLGDVAAFAGGRHDVFIRSLDIDGPLAFAGEADTQVSAPCAEDTGSRPEDTVKCLVEAIKHGDRRTWESLFATWRFTELGAGMPPIFHADYRVRSAVFDRAWERARRSIMGKVHDARLEAVSAVRVLHEGGDSELPRIEQVRAIVDHIALIDGAHRTFVNLDVRRVWRLQRLGDGPWRLVDVQGL